MTNQQTPILSAERFFTVSEVAKLLRISRAQAYILINRKELPYIRLSERRIVIRESELYKWIEAKASGQ